ncbi:microneme associated antigen [Plasmodium reichenowi]|uniref:Microneme associated antigen n=1 Tax=Plasmodium reichenowi TaxID=5854 RepID=A0A060RSR0_PLARE|nr:microneme associated antigen, putative [Plasmodium reichenowi]KYO02652.1 microneme associated antigen, putative [Plasmodium reichenowi]CDO62584.1 microneme associated antigen, putative [Plasmodium reichenowi]SOV75923.1 microneme associated antigen [Plasmodium reichenowi]
MHDFFLKSKFNILSSPLFNNFYKRNKEDEYFKKDRNNNEDLRVMHNYADDSEWREHNNKKDKMTSLKNELNEQLIYSYYNNFNNNYEYYNKSTEKLKEKYNEDDEYNEEQEYEPTANLLQDKNKMNDMNNFYNNFNKNSLFNYQNFQNADKNFLYLLNKKNKSNLTNENILVDEFKKLKNHVLFLQMMNVNLQKQLLTNHLIHTSKIMPHHIIINNKTEVSSNALSEIKNNKEKKKNGTMYILLKKILSSRFNQMIFVSSIFISFYLINKHWQRALKISQLQKKINSNFLLKSVRLFEESLGIRKNKYL